MDKLATINKAIFYTQVQLYRQIGNAIQKLICWVPEKLGRKRNILKLYNNGTWGDGWLVYEVFTKQEESYLLHFEHEYPIFKSHQVQRST